MKAVKFAGVVGAAAALFAGVGTGTPAAQAATVAPCWMLDDAIYQTVNPTYGSSLLMKSATEAASSASSGFTQNNGTVFMGSIEAGQGLVGVHRLYNAKARDFMFTTNTNEITSAVASYGYKDEGVRFYASSAPGNCTVGVMRFVKGSMHRMSADPADQAALLAAGWRSEGVKFYGAPQQAPATASGSNVETSSGDPSISAPSPTTGTKPSAATTGVPSGTPLTQYQGNITVTRDNTVIEGMDIHGFVNIKAKNVTIRKSIVRGGVAATNNTGLVTNYGYPGLLLEDVDLQPEFPSVYIDGIKGYEFTARRVHVVGGVDSVKIQGDNVTIENSLLENTQYYANDPNQGGTGTHNDNIQILKGKNLTIRGNTIRGATGFGVLGAANQGDLPNLVVSGNWLDGGWCSLKLQLLNGHSLTATAVNNKFGRNQGDKKCAFQAEPGVNLTESGNVFESDSTPVSIVRKAS